MLISINFNDNRRHKKFISQHSFLFYTLLFLDLSWSLTNDLIMSASSDKTIRIWNSVGGSCLRIVNDYWSSEVNCCIFHPVNNNHIVVSLDLQ